MSNQPLLAAPARMARDIRSRLSWDARRELRGELRKDLTKLPEKRPCTNASTTSV